MLHESFIPLIRCMKMLKNSNKSRILTAIGSYLMDFHSVFKQVDDSNEYTMKVKKNDVHLKVIFDCLYDEIEKINDKFDDISLTRFIDQ